MAISEKYSRTYHYPFSPGTTSDDRINYGYWDCIQQIPTIIHTEKLDGENNCLSRYGVFARSHGAPTVSPWTENLRRFWQLIKHDLGDLEIFLENLYAVHSIEYRNIDRHYYVFGVRLHDKWLGWEEIKFYANMLDLPVVPEIAIINTPAERISFEKTILEIVNARGSFEPFDAAEEKSATIEGIVTRSYGEYSTADFQQNVFKYVRKGHVKTDAHWTRNWKRATLNHERR